MREYAEDQPIYELWVNDQYVATLCAPKWEEMFWCSYRVVPLDPDAEKVIRDPLIWEKVNFVVKDPKGSQLPPTFSGGYAEFCSGKADRLSFRSLWPPADLPTGGLVPGIRFGWRFGLRGLLAIVLVMAIVFAWVAWQHARGDQHERIATQLQSLGCRVQFSHMEQADQPNGKFREESALPVMVERLGFAKVLRRITSVTLQKEADIPAVWPLLKQVGRLDRLSMGREASVSPDQWADLLNSLRVQKLYLHGQSLPRTRIAWLNHAPMTWLCVARTQFSNPAIDDLPVSLQYFDATRTRINDAGLPSFLRLKKLKKLKLNRTPTSRSAIEALQKQMPWCEIKWEPLELARM